MFATVPPRAAATAPDLMMSNVPEIELLMVSVLLFATPVCR